MVATLSPTRPTRLDFNPFIAPHLDDPYPFYARARQETPVFFSPIVGMWLVLLPEDIQIVLSDHEHFSSAGKIFDQTPLSPEVLAVLENHDVDIPVINTDPPAHNRLRALIGKVFSRKAIAALEPSIQTLIDQAISGFIEDKQADLISQLAYELPMTVIADMLGVPRSDLGMINQWCEEWSLLMWGNLPLEQQLVGARSFLALQQYYTDLVSDREKSPQNDMTTALLQVQAEGELPLTRAEIINFMVGMLLAGHNTTTCLIGNAFVQMLRHRDAWQAIQDHPDLTPQAVEEVLRMDGAGMGMFRLTLKPIALSGVTIPAGERVFVSFASANRDPRYFPEPDRFDIYRSNSDQHFTFGKGIHYCLGAYLARMECRMCLQTAAARLPNLRLQSPQIQYAPNLLLRGPVAVPVVWD